MVDIITINKDNKIGLQKTIESVINQTAFDKINYIIIDGGSTDGSKELIEQYKDKLKYWQSETDNGIYAAMNASISHLEAPYSLFLNSGDYLYSNDVIERCMPYLGDNYGIVYGDEYKVRPNGTRYIAKYPSKLDESFFQRTSLPHQSTFIRSDLVKKYKYNEDYKIISDWILLRQITIEDKLPYLHMPFVVSNYMLDGFSYRNVPLMRKEKEDYYKKS